MGIDTKNRAVARQPAFRESAVIVKFITSFATPKRPQGDEVEVLFDPSVRSVVGANYLHNDRPLRGRSMRYLRSRVEETVELVGWKNFSTKLIRAGS